MAEPDELLSLRRGAAECPSDGPPANSAPSLTKTPLRNRCFTGVAARLGVGRPEAITSARRSPPSTPKSPPPSVMVSSSAACAVLVAVVADKRSRKTVRPSAVATAKWRPHGEGAKADTAGPTSSASTSASTTRTLDVFGFGAKSPLTPSMLASRAGGGAAWGCLLSSAAPPPPPPSTPPSSIGMGSGGGGGDS